MSPQPVAAPDQAAPAPRPDGTASAIVAPKARGPLASRYPQGASGGATVVLRLGISAAGSVGDVRVIEGEEPFASAAVESATSWRFEPAMRAGQPVWSVIRVEIRFTPPLGGEEAPGVDESLHGAQSPGGTGAEGSGTGAEGSGTGAEGSAAPPRPKDRASPLEVTVHGEKRVAPVGASLARAEVRQLPGAFGDPLRAIEIMPGVTPICSGVPYFFVRGAPPGNLGYFVDGVRLPLLFHFALGPSVVHPALIERVDLYPGGYPAKFGRFAGGIVTADVAALPTTLRGELSARLYDAGALLETPFRDGKGSMLAGGRYAYPGLILRLFAPRARFEYWDYQARASYRIADRDSLTVFAFGSHDFLGQNHENGSLDFGMSTGFHRADLRWDHTFQSGARSRTAVTIGEDRSQETSDGDDTYLRDRMVSVRNETQYRLSSRSSARFGADFLLDSYDGRTEEEPTNVDQSATPVRRESAVFPDRLDVSAGAYVDLSAKVEPRVEVTPGLRMDVYSSKGVTKVGLDPRISARISVAEGVRIVHAYGLAHQMPSFVVPIPGVQVYDLARGLQRGVQTAAGVEVDLPYSLSGSVTLFQNAFFNMTDMFASLIAGVDGGAPSRRAEGAVSNGNDAALLTERVSGHSAGVEVVLRRSLTQRLGGFLAYTLSRSDRIVNGRRYLSMFDRTHVFNLALGYDLGRSWRVGTRFVYYSGVPAYDLAGVDAGTSIEEIRTGAAIYKGGRLPPFYRIDLRVEKRWRVGERGWMALVIELLNATLHKETLTMSCTSSGCKNEEIGPVTVPSLGVEAGF